VASYSWSDDSNGNWNTTSNWKPSGSPVGGDFATLPNFKDARNYTVTIDRTVGSAATPLELLTITAGNTFSPAVSLSGSLTTLGINYSTAAGGVPTPFTINSGGLLFVTDVVESVAVTETITIAGSDAGGTLELGTPALPDDNVTFDFANTGPTDVNKGVIQFDNESIGATTTQTITDVAEGNEFVFPGLDLSGDTVLLDTTANVLTVTGTSGTVLTMDNVFLQSGATNAFAIVNGDTIQAVCYARGTMLRTPNGELPVEKLRSGKQVITLVDGQEVPKTVVWLGHRRINIARHSQREKVAPVRIRRDAVADGMPHRDLIVSPDHALFVDGKLICARQLANGSTIRQETDWTSVDYYHVELDEHAILLAEGLPAESYLNTGNQGFFANSGGPLVLHPDLTDESDYPTREAGSCAPFVWDEANVRPVWQRLADRAAAVGLPGSQRATTTEPNLHLRDSDGERNHRRPIYADSNLAIFMLPRGAEQVRLFSRAQSPTDARPWLEDRRRLGVRVQRIMLRGANELREIPMDHPGLSKGWWDIERDGQVMSRWTNGDATVPLPAMDGHVMLELHLAGEMIYAVEVEPESQTHRRAA
jgi:hypothetical protein